MVTGQGLKLMVKQEGMLSQVRRDISQATSWSPPHRVLNRRDPSCFHKLPPPNPCGLSELFGKSCHCPRVSRTLSSVGPLPAGKLLMISVSFSPDICLLCLPCSGSGSWPWGTALSLPQRQSPHQPLLILAMMTHDEFSLPSHLVVTRSRQLLTSANRILHLHISYGCHTKAAERDFNKWISKFHKGEAPNEGTSRAGLPLKLGRQGAFPVLHKDSSHLGLGTHPTPG